MAIYHCSIKIISRSSGRSAIAASAYRAGEKLLDKEKDIEHDYTKKQGVVFSQILLPQNAPKEYKDRQILWEEVQKIEKASNAQLAREFEIALPKELNLPQSKVLIQNFCKDLVKEGMCIDLAIHDKGDGNRHAHIMATTRAIKENGQWATKEKKDYALDENGERIPLIDPKTGQQKVDNKNRKQWKRITIEANDWNKREKVEQWRENWTKHCNRYLKTHNVQIDHRSYKRQGLDKIPTIHEGYAARLMEKNGKTSDRCQINREIAQLEELEKEEKLLQIKQEELIKLQEYAHGRLEAFDNRRRIIEQTRRDGARELRTFINGERTQKNDRGEGRKASETRQDKQRQSNENSKDRRTIEKERKRDFGMGF